MTCALGGAAPAARAGDTPAQFDFDELARRAELLAGRPYSPPEASLPDWISELDYDSYRRIAFNPEKALLGGTKFALQFFHPGYYFKEPVAISLIEDGRERPIEFASDMFIYDGVDAAGPMPDGLELRRLPAALSA